jgi:hypothetical protein
VLLGAPYEGDATAVAAGPAATLHAAIDAGQVPARELLASYCRLLYARHGTYEEVARRTELDRRTVKRHIEGAA